jgi:hypothetical protein
MFGSLLLLFLDVARAEAPTYRYESGETVRYYMDNEFFWGKGVKASARENINTRMQGFRMRAEAECVAKPYGKNTELRCTLPWILFTADPQNDSQERIDLVMADWMDYTHPVKISFLVTPDGRLREFDVNGLPEGNIREGQLADQMRSTSPSPPTPRTGFAAGSAPTWASPCSCPPAPAPPAPAP